MKLPIRLTLVSPYSKILLCCVIVAAPSLLGQTIDYVKADRIRTYDPLLIGGRVYPHWTKDGTRFYYTEWGVGPNRGVVFLVDPAKGQKHPLFDNGRIAAVLTSASGIKVEPSNLPNWELNNSDQTIETVVGNHRYRCDLDQQTCALDSLQTGEAAKPPGWVVRSPDKQWDAFLWHNNVYIRPSRLTDADVKSAQGSVVTPFPPQSDSGQSPHRLPGKRVEHWCDEPVLPGVPAETPSQPLPSGSIALTTDGTALWGYSDEWRGGLEVAHLDREGASSSRGSLMWSPDSRKLLVRRQDLRNLRTYPLYSSTSAQPVDHSYLYAVPGDAHVPEFDWYLLTVSDRSSLKIQVPPTGLTGVPGAAYWGNTSEELWVLTSDRGPKNVTLWRVDTRTGAAQALIHESSETFVELQNGGEDANVKIVNGGDDIFWFSERNGWGHLYRYAKDGSLKNQLEDGQYSLGDTIKVDAAAKQVYFTAWGKAPGIPYYAHLYRVNFDGSGLTLLTPEPGNHTIQFAPHAPYFLDTYSTIESPPKTVLRSNDGKLILELSTGNTTGLRATGWTPAETFMVKARDGVTDLYGVMYKPSTFDPSHRYPVIVNIYPGPFEGSVSDWVFKGPDSVLGTSVETRNPRYGVLRITHGEGMGRSLAELGFIVIQLNSLGTSRRSKSFEDYFYGHDIDNGLPDQVSAIHQLALRFPWFDSSRVGVFGHSGGGYAAATAMLQYPDVFKVGVSESGNHDIRAYGWYWGEKYQGLSVKKDNYAAQADYTLAANLKGKLFLIHGDMDCNNHPAETLRDVDALIKADKNFDMLLVPDTGHQLPDYVTRRAWDYFVRNLLGAEPPDDYHMLPSLGESNLHAMRR